MVVLEQDLLQFQLARQGFIGDVDEPGQHQVLVEPALVDLLEDLILDAHELWLLLEDLFDELGQELLGWVKFVLPQQQSLLQLLEEMRVLNPRLLGDGYLQELIQLPHSLPGVELDG